MTRRSAFTINSCFSLHPAASNFGILEPIEHHHAGSRKARFIHYREPELLVA